MQYVDQLTEVSSATRRTQVKDKTEAAVMEVNAAVLLKFDEDDGTDAGAGCSH